MFRQQRGRNVGYYCLKQQKAVLKRPQGQVKPSVRKAGYRKKIRPERKIFASYCGFLLILAHKINKISMKLEGRRESQNVEDRRGGGSFGGFGGFGGRKSSLGIGGVIVVGLLVWLMGGDPLTFLSQQVLDGGGLTTGSYTPTAEEEETAVFARKILAGTEDVWKKVFSEQLGREYEPPTMVLFSGSTSSGCGSASAATGPFYCSADRTLYIDLSFFSEMQRSLHAGGDFAYAYVIAHEVGHHVQYLLGTLDKVHAQEKRVSETEANRLSVRTELQADFYAGVWGYYDNKLFGSLEEGDIEEGINAANQIGDDRLQMQSQGYTVPDAFNHGTSAQRARWLKKGLQTGNMRDGDTFSLNYNSL